MKSAGALLLDVSATRTLSSELQGILETAFTVTVPPNLSQKISSTTLDEELTQLARRADAGLIFLIVAEVALAESRNLLAALKRVVPEVPIIAALERCDPEQA